MTLWVQATAAQGALDHKKEHIMGLMDEVKHKAETLGDRAKEAATHAKEGPAGGLIDKAKDKLKKD